MTRREEERRILRGLGFDYLHLSLHDQEVQQWYQHQLTISFSHYIYKNSIFQCPY